MGYMATKADNTLGIATALSCIEMELTSGLFIRWSGKAIGISHAMLLQLSKSHWYFALTRQCQQWWDA